MNKSNTESASKFSSLFSLFWSFLRISLFTLGGGAVMLPLMEEEFVRKKKLLSEAEMLDVISVTNSLPGVIAINSSVLIGHMVKGLAGSLFSLTGVLLPPFLIILLLAELLLRTNPQGWIEYLFLGVRAGVTALLLTVLVRFCRKQFRVPGEYFIAVGAFFAVQFLRVNALFVLLAAGIIGWFMFRIKKERTSL